jgi:hypothetical protein
MYTKEIYAIVQVKEVIAKLDLLILFAQSAEIIDLSTKIGLNAFSTLRDELSTTIENAFQSALSGNGFEPASLELQATISVVNTFLLTASNEAATSVFQSLTVNLTETLINANTVLINATQTPEPIPDMPAPKPDNVCSFIPESPSYINPAIKELAEKAGNFLEWEYE